MAKLLYVHVRVIAMDDDLSLIQNDDLTSMSGTAKLQTLGQVLPLLSENSYVEILSENEKHVK